ncbi:hypothetical protein J2W48_004586 [Flavobacterium piscis]|uniref:Uncharacterized protein n=1 Tax=Flavobacterium piscis TaxID=1114874 RepID=A0ABU1YGD9_9FLAO|nr:hypothetical protein [Flavobacterium piscis]
MSFIQRLHYKRDYEITINKKIRENSCNSWQKNIAAEVILNINLRNLRKLNCHIIE